MIARRRTRDAFTLLEVVIAMAMLALIAVPAVGLATMAAKKTQANLSAGKATELKKRIEAAVRAADPFSAGLVGATFYASSDLRYIERGGEGEPLSEQNDRYFRLTLSEPVGYHYNANDPYRLYICHMAWPHAPSPGEETRDIVTLLVFRK